MAACFGGTAHGCEVMGSILCVDIDAVQERQSPCRPSGSNSELKSLYRTQAEC